MKCLSCSFELNSFSSFCPKCGTPVGATRELSPETQTLSSPHSHELHWAEFKKLSILYLILLGTSLITGIINFISPKTILIVYETVFDAVVILTYCWMYRKDVIEGLNNFKPLKSLGWLALGGAVTYLFMNVYFYLIIKLGAKTVDYKIYFQHKNFPLWSIYFLISIMPGIFEELAFRGVIFSGLLNYFSTFEALIVQAMLFSVLHLSPLIFISHFIMGLILGTVRLRSGSLYSGMILHASWNAYVLWGG